MTDLRIVTAGCGFSGSSCLCLSLLADEWNNKGWILAPPQNRVEWLSRLSARQSQPSPLFSPKQLADGSSRMEVRGWREYEVRTW